MNKFLVIGALLALGAVGGLSLNAMQSYAQDTQVTTAQATQAPAPQGAQMDESKAMHVGANGQREELLTGDTAEKVRAAALQAVPGGTIQRVETEVDGNGIYEAHMTKSDGTRVTVYFDNSFNVTSTQDGSAKRGQEM